MPWAATRTRAIITWPRVKWHRETEEQVRNAPISLPAGFQLPTLIECLLWNLLAEETNDLCLDFYPRLICLGNKSSLDIIVSRPPGIMTKAGGHHHIAVRIHNGGVALPVHIACWLSKVTLASWRWKEEVTCHCFTKQL